MIKKIIATLIVLLFILPVQARLLTTWGNFDILWGGTNATGGIVTIASQEGFGSFEAEVGNFSESYYWTGDDSPPPVERFLTFKKGSEVEFDPWLMFVDRENMPDQWNASSIGSGYDKYPGNPFTVTEFRSAFWQIDDNRITSSVPEPTTMLMLVLGLIGLTIATKKKRQLPLGI